MTPLRFKFSWPCLLPIFLILISQVPVIGQTLQIDRLKANYILNFIDFARWEKPLKAGEITIGAICKKDLVIELKRISNGSRGGPVVNIVPLEGSKNIPLDEIDLLFIGAGNTGLLESLKEDWDNLSILLVGEDEHFLEEGGAIQFTFMKNRLRFYVDQNNANTLGIELSSKLIELAVEQSQ